MDGEERGDKSKIWRLLYHVEIKQIKKKETS